MKKLLKRWMGANGFLLMTLVPVVLVGGMWVRSYWVYDSWAWSWEAEHHVESTQGTIKKWSDIFVIWSPRGPEKRIAPRYTIPELQGTEDDSRPLPTWPVWDHESQRNYDFGYLKETRYGIMYETIPDIMARLRGRDERSLLTIRYWLIFMVVCVIPAGIVGRRIMKWVRSRNRVRAGLCAKCGYDLRMHAEGQRCPECGEVIGEWAVSRGER